MCSTLDIQAAAGSHMGLVRKTNEDSVAAVQKLGIFMIADGIGGHAAGEVASRMALDVVCVALGEYDPDETWPHNVPQGMDRDQARFIMSVQRANQEIFRAAQRDIARRGMGTTFAGVLVTGGRAYVAHVGDSRVYWHRAGRLEQLTRDHTLREELLRRESPALDALGGLNEEIAHRITRAVGTDPTVDVETRVMQPEPGDVLLVCSDGLWGPVAEGEIASMLAWPGRPAAIVAGLIGRALERGGPDNVTCVVMRFVAKAG